MRASARTSGSPAWRARAFCSSTAWRTDGMPPRSTCSATGRCSGGSESRTASRCWRPGWSRFGRGRDGGAAASRGRREWSARSRGGRSDGGRSRGGRSDGARSRGGRSRGGRSDGARSRGGRSDGARSRGGRSVGGRSRLASRRRSPPGRRSPSRRGRSRSVGGPPSWVTGSSGRLDPMIARRSRSERLALGGKRAVIRVPSRSISQSARTRSPTFAPGKSSDASRVPFGWRAPAARQVHVPSGRELVSSMSMRGTPSN
jgi:hypothetical protein